MKEKNDYDSFCHEKYLMRYHIIFSTKYRKKFLKGQLAEDIKSYMLKASEEQKWSIEIQEIDSLKPDHIHLLIKSTPSIAVYEIVKRLKQYSCYYLWQNYNSYMSKIYWSGKHYLWTKGYFCATVGNASVDTIKNYIEKQG